MSAETGMGKSKITIKMIANTDFAIEIFDETTKISSTASIYCMKSYAEIMAHNPGHSTAKLQSL